MLGYNKIKKFLNKTAEEPQHSLRPRKMAGRKCWPVASYAKCIDEKWAEKKVDKEKCVILIEGPQLLLIDDGVALESVCLLGGSGTVQATRANAQLGISVVVDKETVLKFKVRMAESGRSTKLESCDKVVQELQKFVPVAAHPSHKGRPPVATDAVKTLPDIVKELVEQDPELLASSGFGLQEHSMLESLRSCLLDPGFPGFVKKVENLLGIDHQYDECDDIN